MSKLLISLAKVDLAIAQHRAGKQKVGPHDRIPYYPAAPVDPGSANGDIQALALALNTNSKYMELLLNSIPSHHDNEFVMSAIRELITRIKLVDQTAGPAYQQLIAQSIDMHRASIQRYEKELARFHKRERDMPKYFADFLQTWKEIGEEIQPILDADPQSRNNMERALHRAIFSVLFRRKHFDSSRWKEKTYQSQMIEAYHPSEVIKWSDLDEIPIIERIDVMGTIKGNICNFLPKT